MSGISVTQIADATSVSATTDYDFASDKQMQLQEIAAVWTAATASFTAKPQGSIDNTNWFDLASAETITNANGSKLWQIGRHLPYHRVIFTRTSGTLDTVKVWGVYSEYGDK